MTEFERRVEAWGATGDDYEGHEFTADQVEQGAHRSFVGGHFDDGWGLHQFEFLKSHGLKPEHKLLDVGCGSFRAGRFMIDGLNPGNYYGIDANHSLMQAGYDVELTDEQRKRLPATNLRASDRFDVDFGVQFDMALAQSVFTHVSLNHTRLCMYRVAKVIAPGGRFYVTFLRGEPRRPLDEIVRPRTAKARFAERDTYWYYTSDIRWAARHSPWRFRYIGDWGSPAGQKMVELTRLTPVEEAARAERRRAKARRRAAAS